MPTLSSWTLGSVPQQNYSAVSYGNNLFVAVALFSSTSVSSSDGITWTQGQGLPGMPCDWTDVIYGDGRWTAISTGGRSAVSIDGIKWNWKHLPYQLLWTAGTWARPYFVAVGYSQGFNQADCGVNRVAITADPHDWGSSIIDSAQIWTDIATNGIDFVAVGRGTNMTAISSVGLHAASWTSTPGLPAVANWSCITASPTTWVAMAAGQNLGAVSQNGVFWTAVQLPLSLPWHDSVWCNGLFLVTSNTASNQVIVSADGVTWEIVTLPATAVWSCAAASGNTVVLLASDQGISAQATVT